MKKLLWCLIFDGRCLGFGIFKAVLCVHLFTSSSRFDSIEKRLFRRALIYYLYAFFVNEYDIIVSAASNATGTCEGGRGFPPILRINTNKKLQSTVFHDDEKEERCTEFRYHIEMHCVINELIMFSVPQRSLGI